MANQQQMTLTEQVRQHGELLVKLTVLVEEDHKDLEELKKSTETIAKAVERQETRDEFKARLLMFGVPVACSIASALAGHFIR